MPHGREIKLPAPAPGESGPQSTAYIDENACIGCVKCIRVCPVDAIIGAPQQMHTVIAALCTGCELCIPPCPVNCISMQPRAEQAVHDTAAAERRFVARTARLEREAEEQDQKIKSATWGKTDDMQKVIEDAVARTRAKRGQMKTIFDRKDQDK